ncbi:MAG: hypothetical protein JWP75_214, partial [Frondihabitans sp.]|nr:hypothetical protein [Frondihabitans sp.]
MTAVATVGSVLCGVATLGVCDAAGAGEVDAGLIAFDAAEIADTVVEDSAVAEDSAAADEAASTKAQSAANCNYSFTGATPVVLASGAAVPIDQIAVGDKVLATNVITGKSSAKTVQKLWDNHDTDLMDVTVTSGGVTATIHATQHHLFWDATSNTWVEADQLHPGDTLHSDNGVTVTVASTKVIPGAHDMW